MNIQNCVVKFWIHTLIKEVNKKKKDIIYSFEAIPSNCDWDIEILSCECSLMCLVT